MTNCCQDTFESAKNGHLQCLKFLYENGYECDPITTRFSARYGHLECLKYLHKIVSVEWHPWTTWVAAEHGHLECLKYAIENGCEWYFRTTWGASHYVQLECLLYCLDNECPIYIDSIKELYKEFYKVLYKAERDLNLLSNINLRKVLFHYRIKDELTEEKYPEFIKTIKEYDEYVTELQSVLTNETSVIQDVIKYEICKYI